MEVPLLELMHGQTLRILLVSVREGAREEIGEILAGKIGDHRLYWVAQPEQALMRAQDVAPHLMLVDSELHGAEMVLLIKQLAARVPGTAILAMVEWDAMGKASEAVLAGARGFVTKPVHADDLISAIEKVLTQRRAASEEAANQEDVGGRVLVFCAPKGGTGRTTLAVNTAVSLRQLSGGAVAMVDADYAAPALDVVLNLDSDRSIADLLPRLSLLDQDLISGVLYTHNTGLRVLLAPPPVGIADAISLPQVQPILEILRDMFAWVVVDLGLPMDETSFSFLDSADRIVMTVLPEMVGLRNVRVMLNQLYARGYPEDKIWLVLNRSTMVGGVGSRDIEERLKVRVKHRIPDDQPLATYSINRGVPLVVSHDRSAVARAVDKLAQRLIEDSPSAALDAQPVNESKGGWLGRLRRSSRSAN